MFYYRSTKVEQFYDSAMDLYFNKGVGATQIVRQKRIERTDRNEQEHRKRPA